MRRLRHLSSTICLVIIFAAASSVAAQKEAPRKRAPVRTGKPATKAADGHTSFIRKTIDAATLLNLFNPNDGQAVKVG